MKKMDQESRTKARLKRCDSMQISLPGTKGWAEMEHVYFKSVRKTDK
jgi:hypothetical protein